MLIQKIEELKKNAQNVMKKFKSHLPMYFLKIIDTDELLVYTPDMIDQETKKTTIKEIRQLIASKKLEEYVFICEGRMREVSNHENTNQEMPQDCLVVLYASPKKEIQYICKCTFGKDEITFSAWDEFESNPNSLKQGLFNNLFDKENCMFN